MGPSGYGTRGRQVIRNRRELNGAWICELEVRRGRGADLQGVQRGCGLRKAIRQVVSDDEDLTQLVGNCCRGEWRRNDAFHRQVDHEKCDSGRVIKIWSQTVSSVGREGELTGCAAGRNGIQNE